MERRAKELRRDMLAIKPTKLICKGEDMSQVLELVHKTYTELKPSSAYLRQQANGLAALKRLTNINQRVK